MSDLILPPQTNNETLNKNLNVFFKRYPHERVRLEHLLSVPVQNRPAVRIGLPAVPSKPPMRVLILAGIGSPFFIQDILNDKTIREETFQIFVIENNIDFLRYLFQYADLTQILAYDKAEWFFMQNTESIKPCFFRTMKREHVAAVMTNVHMLETDIPQPDDVKEFYSKLPAIYDETVHHVYHNFGRISDSLDGVKATLMNHEAILSYPGINELKGAFRGIPALIVGAGPSLDKELQLIKENNNKFLVIAADAALKPLITAGIRVDYVTSIERLNDYQKPFFEGLEPVTVELVAFPVIQPDQFKIYPGPARLCYRNYSFFAYFDKNWPKGIVKCGGSTAHLAMRLADWFGCSRAYMIGLDSAYERKEGTNLYRSHCSGTGHQNWGDFVELSEFNRTRMHLPPIKGINNLGEEVMTNMTYYQWIKEYTEELAEIGQRMTIINCSPIGLKIEGIPFIPLSEVKNHLQDQIISKPEQKAVRFNRQFKHKEIVKNFDAWVKLMTDAIKECDDMLAEETIDTGRFEALMFIYNFRICVDSLFVAFVVQCCAKEFFEFENKWWALDKSWLVDQKEKVQVTKERLQLFKGVVEQLQTIFKEASDEQVHQRGNVGISEEKAGS